MFSWFLLNRCYSLLSFGGPQLYNSEALPFTYGQYVVVELADKLDTLLLFVFCASWKYIRSQAETKCGLGALQHSLWADPLFNRLAIWTKALWVLCESMNFHPDKQLFQVAGAGDRNTDPWGYFHFSLLQAQLHTYRISAYSFRGNYSFLTLALCTVTFDHST